MSKKMANKILAAALSLGAVMNNGGIGSAMENKEEKISNSQRRDKILNYGLRYGKKGLNLLKENVGFRDILGLLAFCKIHRDLLNYGKVPLGTLLDIVERFKIDDSSRNFAACDAAQTLLKYYNNEHNRKLLLKAFLEVVREEVHEEDSVHEKDNEEEVEEVEKEDNKDKKEEIKEKIINEKEDLDVVKKEGNIIEEEKPVEWFEQRVSFLSFLFRNFKFEEISRHAGDKFISLLRDVAGNEKNYKAKDWEYCVSNARKFLEFYYNKKIFKIENEDDNPDNNPIEGEKVKKQQELEKAQKEYNELVVAIPKLEEGLKGLDKEKDKDDIAKKIEVLEANKKRLEELKVEIGKLNKELGVEMVKIN